MSKSDPAKDSAIKAAATLLLGFVLLALIYNVFFAPGPMNYGMGAGTESAGMHQAGTAGDMGSATLGGGLDLGLGSLLAWILYILVKLLSVVLVIGLVTGLWVVIRDYIYSDGENPLGILINGYQKNKKNCPKCGSAVNTGWDFCPDCGEKLHQARPTVKNENSES